MSLDLTQFHEAFYEESFEAIGSMEESLLKLDVGAPEPELVNTIFRVAHSIKGGAATFGFSEISSFTHTLETLLDELRAQRMQVTVGLMDLLLKSVDVMRDMLRAQRARKPIDAQRVADLQFDLELAVAQKAVVAAAPAATAAVDGAAARQPVQGFAIRFKPMLHLLARGNDPLRIFGELRQLGELHVQVQTGALPSLERLDPENCHLAWTLELETMAPRAAVAEIFDWAEGDCELAIEPLAAAAPASARAGVGDAQTLAVIAESGPPPAEDRQGRAGETPRGPDASSIRVSIDKIDHLMNSVGELVITQSMLGQLAALAEGPQGERLRSGLAQLERNVRELQESVMRVRMVPISFVFSRFPRMVRDLSQRLGKHIELKMTGGETELDKTVLEKIGDPLVHLVRNCIDHGVERPDLRVAAGKTPGGTVHLHACHRGSNIQVEVRDDGGGLKTDKILAIARERGLVGPEETLEDEQIHRLIFMAGFSTAELATDISGRGVGMDVVRRNVEGLGGSIEVGSEPGKGACFTISLPLTLAIVDGQTVAVGDDTYIVPLTAIVESLQMRTASINRLGGRGELLSFRGDFLPVVRLNEVFASPRTASSQNGNGLVMVVEGDGRRVGLCVDELLGQQQVVVKTLEDNYGHVDGIAGATILGDGAVALILDVAGLTRTATGRAAA
jgi:two-component system, chemotaxis family, sensor kinase CheA